MPNETAGTHRPDTRELPRNAKARRLACRLSVAEVADRGGLTESWVEAVENGSAPWSLTSLSQLATALECSIAALLSADHDPFGSASETLEPPRVVPELDVMGEEECYARLALQSVGRICPGNAPEPFVVPVNYVLDDRDVVFRTRAGSLPSTAEGQVAFEVDDLVAPAHLGWSVLILGDARQVTDEAELQRLAGTGLTSWAGGDRGTWIRIRPARVTGRRIAPRKQPSRTEGETP
ncbi:MAG: helix-turn-helix domain-containing protein [Saccharothrix sp.]|nr:helix-turn-helix domain-containing protein [Saccharothrix sp.]